MIELKHKKNTIAREDSAGIRMISESLILETPLIPLQKTLHKHTNVFFDQISTIFSLNFCS